MEAARAMDDGGLDDPIEPEDPTDVNSFSLPTSLFIPRCCFFLDVR